MAAYLPKSEDDHFSTACIWLQGFPFEVRNQIACDDFTVSASLDCLLLLGVIYDVSDSKNVWVVDELQSGLNFDVAGGCEDLSAEGLSDEC